MVKPNEVTQGSDEWFALRLGKVTASKISDVMSKGVGRERYQEALLAERLTGQAGSSFTNASMQWGTEQEPFARQAYEIDHGFVEETGFWQHEELQLGVSPDGLVDEIKCPNSSTHASWLRDKKVPSKHIKQIQAQLWVTNRDWCDFVSFDPRMTLLKNRLMVVRCERDDVLIKKMEEEVKRFLNELDQLYKSIGEQ